MADSVPAELVGREVSARALIPLWEAVRDRGIDAERLTAGTGYTIEHLTNPRERVSWQAFARFMTNLGQIFGDDELVALGGAALESRWLRALLLPGRMLFGVSEIYRWVFAPTGPASQLIATQDGRIVELAPGVLRFETRMKPGYSVSRENYLLMRGTLIALSQALGVARADVTHTPIEGGVIFDIRIREGGGALGYVRRRLSWVFAARSAAEELERAHRELNERYLELQREIDRRIGVETELRHVNDELERRVSERTAELESFTYAVSHDLRGPLRAMDGFNDALLEDYAAQLDDRGREYLQRVRAATARMGEIIDGLLELSRVARAELMRQPIDLTAVARSVLAELARLEPQREVELAIAERLTVDADPRLLRILLHNLLGNAWKFTRHARAPRIELAAAGGNAFVVHDNGAGFDMEYAHQLFEPFKRLHKSEDFPGTGIGLATVHRIVTRHGGRVWAESAPGAGASFYFTLTPEA